MHRAFVYRRQRVCHGALAIIVCVDANRPGDRSTHVARKAGDFPRHRAAVRVAQHHHLGSAAHRRPQGLQGIGRVGLVAVEEVLGVVDHTLAA